MSDKLDPGFEEIPLDEGFEEVVDLSAEDRKSIEGYLNNAEEMSKAEAFGTSFGRGATLGFADELAGATTAGARALGVTGVEKNKYSELGLDSPTLDKEKLLEAYRKGKKAYQDKEDQAWEQHPGTYIAGEVTGGLLTPIPGSTLAKTGKIGKMAAKVLPSLKGADKISKAAKLAKKAKKLGNLQKYDKFIKAKRSAQLGLASREGLKAGAIGAAGVTEADPTEGKFYKDVAIGGTLGVAVSAGFVKTGHLASDAFNTIPGARDAVESFMYGWGGKSLDAEAAKREARKISNEHFDRFTKVFKNLSQRKKKIFNEVKEAGGVNTKEELEALRTKILSQKKTIQEKKEVQELFDLMGDYVGDGKAVRKAEDKLEKQLIKAGLVDPEEVAQKKVEKKMVKDAVGRELAMEDDMAGAASETVEGVEAIGKKAVFGGGDAEDGVIKTYREGYTKPTYTKIQRTVDPTSGKQVISSKDISTGEVKAIVLDPPSFYNSSKLDPEETEVLRKHLQRYIDLKDNAKLPSEVREAAIEASNLIKSKLENTAEKIGKPLKDINKKLSAMISIENKLKLPKVINEETKQEYSQKLAKFVIGVGDENPFDDQTFVMRQLKKVDPALAQEFKEKVTEMRNYYKISQQSKPTQLRSVSERSIAGDLTGLINRVSNAMGRAGYNLKGQAKKAAEVTKDVASAATKPVTNMANKTLGIVQMDNNKLGQLIQKAELGGKGAKFADTLKKVYGMDNVARRNAILWGLSQQPAFRNFFETFNEEEE